MELQVCKITFGSEAKDCEVYEFILKHLNTLQFSPPTKVDIKQDIKINPKRMQREIRKQLDMRGTGTKSQHALRIQHEQNKVLCKEENREQKEAKKQFNLN